MWWWRSGQREPPDCWGSQRGTPSLPPLLLFYLQGESGPIRGAQGKAVRVGRGWLNPSQLLSDGNSHPKHDPHTISLGFFFFF